MRIHTRITAEARARGLTAAEVARRVRGYRSNLSAMDAGRRSLSLRTLARLSQVLACSPGELLDVQWAPAHPLFRQALLNQRVSERDRRGVDGLEKGWVHTVQLAWVRHYRQRARR